MRGAIRLPFLGSTVLFLIVAVFPAFFALRLLLEGNIDLTPTPAFGDLLTRTALWSASVALGALVLGWAPGSMLAVVMQSRLFAPVAALCIVPVCLPAYLHYWCWWQMWAADTWLQQWAIESGRMPLLRACTLYLALVMWSWPIAAWCTAVALGHTDSGQLDLERIDGVGIFRRMVNRIRVARVGLLVAFIVILLAIFNNTVAFDLARVSTLGYELRAISRLGGAGGAVVGAAWPGALVTMVGLGVLWRLGRRGQPKGLFQLSARIGYGQAVAAGMVWCVSMGIPMWLLLRQANLPSAWETISIGYDDAIRNTLLASAIAAGFVAVLMVFLCCALMASTRFLRRVMWAQCVIWILIASIPATVVAVSLEELFNGPPFAHLAYETPLAMIVGYVARFGLVGALAAMMLVWIEPESRRSMRALDGVRTFLSLLVVNWPRLLCAGAGVFAIVLVLSISEVLVTSRLQPPGFDAIASILLSNIHYQRNGMVVLLAVMLFGMSLVVAGVVVLCVHAFGWMNARRVMTTAFVVAGCCFLSGCEDDEPSFVAEKLKTELAFGGVGRGFGQFVYPRAIGADSQRERLYIVDRSGRIQIFAYNGKPLDVWMLPDSKEGYPTGITVAPDGRVFIADTHNFRVTIFSPEGEVIDTWGRFGAGPGEFQNPCDVAFGPDGRVYVAEFGGNDRVQVFDAGGDFLFSFGAFGSDPGMFNRPQSLAFSPDGERLYIADAANHRLQVFDSEGQFLETIGEIGAEPGQFRYPYGVVVLDDGRLLVSEFGNNRLQVLTPDGEPLAVLGGGGKDRGELYAPWSSVEVDDMIFVLDSRNSRVQMIRKSF